jgi:hypothetical protein
LVFTVTDDALKVRDLQGRIAIEIGGKVYNPDLAAGHGH